MPEHNNSLISRQLAELEELHKISANIGGFIAEETWGKLESELESQTREGLMWDFSHHILNNVQMELCLAFYWACDKWITKLIETMGEAMKIQQGQDWCYSAANSELNTLIQGQRLGKRLAPRIERLFNQAKPGIVSLLARAMLDKDEGLNTSMEKNAHKDAARLQQVFYHARQDFIVEISQLATELLRKACNNYANILHQTSYPTLANNAQTTAAN